MKVEGFACEIPVVLVVLETVAAFLLESASSVPPIVPGVVAESEQSVLLVVVPAGRCVPVVVVQFGRCVHLAGRCAPLVGRCVPAVVAQFGKCVPLAGRCVPLVGRCALAAPVVVVLSEMFVAGSVASVVECPLGFEAVVEQIDSHHPSEWWPLVE